MVLALSHVEFVTLARNGCWLPSTKCAILRSIQSVILYHGLFVQQQPKHSRSRKEFLKPEQRSSILELTFEQIIIYKSNTQRRACHESNADGAKYECMSKAERGFFECYMNTPLLLFL